MADVPSAAETRGTDATTWRDAAITKYGPMPSTDPAVIDQCAALLLDSPRWIVRRKDRVTIVDDTMVRHQQTVDFEVREGIRTAAAPRSNTGKGAAHCCAPLFVLPKRPSNYMAFDLVDETGKSLSLRPRADNAWLTALLLEAMATQELTRGGSEPPVPLDDEVTKDLYAIALGDPCDVLDLARRRASPLDGDANTPAWVRLRSCPRFLWWLRTAADSSIVIVDFEAIPHRDKRIKLSHQSALIAENGITTRLGWRTAKFLLDNPWIEGRSYHIEADAPQGLAIRRAWLGDDFPEPREPTVWTAPPQLTAPRRSVHLYRDRADRSGAGASTFELSASGDGFLLGALLASIAVVVAITVCLAYAAVIARNPTTAPSVFLILPGLLAAYTGRTDAHALTTRLLSGARIALACAAGAAYASGVRLALLGGPSDKPGVARARTESIELVLWPALGIAAIAATILAIGLLRHWPYLQSWMDKDALRARLGTFDNREFVVDHVIRTNPAEALTTMYSDHEHAIVHPRANDWPPPESSSPEDLALPTHQAPAALTVIRSRALYVMTFQLTSSAHPGGTAVSAGCYIAPRKGLPRWMFAALGTVWRAKVEARLTEWADACASAEPTPPDVPPATATETAQ